MRIAIVDDLADERAWLKERLARQLALRGAEAELLEFDSGESFLAAEKTQRFTAAFLDIYMDGMSGMEAAFSSLPQRLPTTHWKAFRYGRCTIWSSPFQSPSFPLCWTKCSPSSRARSHFWQSRWAAAMCAFSIGT